MTDIIKPPEKTFSLTSGKLTSKASTFQDRVRANRAQQQAVSDEALGVPNRIQLALDCSGSMGGYTDHKSDKSKMLFLKDAVSHFIDRCNFADTAVGIQTFGAPNDDEPTPLTRDATRLKVVATTLDASGPTLMRACMTRVVETPLTRAVIVSDGQATDWHRDYEEDSIGMKSDLLIKKYIEAGIPIDCVHIGDSTQGEQLLRDIAKATGGVFIKFTDVSAFSTAFGYLSPVYRAMLTDGRIDVKQLGASEVKT